MGGNLGFMKCNLHLKDQDRAKGLLNGPGKKWKNIVQKRPILDENLKLYDNLCRS